MEPPPSSSSSNATTHLHTPPSTSFPHHPKRPLHPTASTHAEDDHPPAKKLKADPSLPQLPPSACSWSDAAHAFHRSLPTSHLQPFTHLISLILATPPSQPPPPPLPSSPAPLPPLPPSYDPSLILTSFPSQPFLSPRGKFDVHLLQSQLVLVNDKAGQALRIPLSPSTLVLRVPDANKKDDCVVFCLAPGDAVMVGKTRYQQLVMKAERRTGAAPAANSVWDAVRAHAGAQGVGWCEASKGVFASSTSSEWVSCYEGMRDGALYPLKEGLLFLKPAVWVGVEHIDGIAISRGSGGGKTFDLQVGVRQADGKESALTFAMISAAEQSRLEEYAQSVEKDVKRREKQRRSAVEAASARLTASEAVGAQLGQVAAGENAQPAAVAAEEDDDEDSEDDSDFAPDSDSDAAEDGSDSDDSQTHSDDMQGEVDASEGGGSRDEGDGDEDEQQSPTSNGGLPPSRQLPENAKRAHVTVISSDSEGGLSEEEEEEEEEEGGESSGDDSDGPAAPAAAPPEDSEDTDAEDEEEGSASMPLTLT